MIKVRISIAKTERGVTRFNPEGSEHMTTVEVEGPIKAISWEEYDGFKVEFYNLEEKDAES